MKDKTSINRKSNTGAVEHETKVHDREGDIMAIATKDVVSIPPTKSIKDTAKVMMGDTGSLLLRRNYCICGIVS